LLPRILCFIVYIWTICFLIVWEYTL
jgi:hypothetical protein